LACASHLPLLHFLFLFFSGSSFLLLFFFRKKKSELYFYNAYQTLLNFNWNGDVFRGLAGVNTSQEKIKHTAFKSAVGQEQMQ